VTVGNPSVDNTYRTFLSSAYSNGITVSVLSNVSFAGNDLLVFGEPGEELTELETLSSITGKTTLTMSAALDFAHPKDTPIYRVNWNFVDLEGRATSAGTFETLTLSPIQWDKLNTVYYHSAGTDTWQYRFRFYNSITATNSEYSPTIAGSGFTRSSVGYMIRQVRQTANDLDGRVSGDRGIIRFFNMAQDIIRGVKSDWSWLKVTDTSVTTTASTKKYALPALIGNLGNVDDIRYRYDDGTNDLIYQLKYIPEKEFDSLDRDQNQSTDDYVTFYTFQEPDSSSASGYIRVNPIPTTSGRGTFYIRYFREMPDMDTVDDETLVPIPSLLENFAVAQMEKIKGNENKSALYEDLFYGKQQVGKRMNNVDVGISLLIKLDVAKKSPAGQPMQLKRWRGRRGVGNFYNNRFVSSDWLKETYF